MAQRKNTEQDEQREERQDEQRSDEAQQDVKVPSEQDLGLDRGYIGQKVDPRPNEEYSQETDPLVSPSASDQAADAARARLEEQERASQGKE